MKKLNDDIITRYLEGSCTESDFAELNTWLKERPENASDLFLFEEKLHASDVRRFASEDRMKKAKKQIDSRCAELDKQEARVIRFRKFFKYAAMFTVVFVSALLGRFLGNMNGLSREILVEVPNNGTVREIQLPDGTRVWLNKGSKLTYSGRFDTRNREVYLNGEAYFEVKRDRKRPFIVNSEALDVRVLGTTFNLKCFKGSLLSEATLIEGEVEVIGNKNEGRIVLSPGQKAELNSKTGRLQVKQVDAKLDAVWRDEMVPFEKATIFEIALVLERFYDVKIILSPEINNNTYSGVLKKGDSIDQVLNSLKNSIPITYRKTGHNVYIQPAN